MLELMYGRGGHPTRRLNVLLLPDDNLFRCEFWVDGFKRETAIVDLYGIQDAIEVALNDDEFKLEDYLLPRAFWFRLTSADALRLQKYVEEGSI